jgi:hypothetical protein
MTDSTTHPFAQRLSQAPDSRLLRSDQGTGADLMCMPEVEEQTEHYLAIEHGDSADRGMLTGALGGGGIFLFIRHCPFFGWGHVLGIQDIPYHSGYGHGAFLLGNPAPHAAAHSA